MKISEIISVMEKIAFVREAAKKKKVPPLVAGPLRGGGGVKAGPLRKKELF